MHGAKIGQVSIKETGGLVLVKELLERSSLSRMARAVIFCYRMGLVKPLVLNRFSNNRNPAFGPVIGRYGLVFKKETPGIEQHL
ncbi:MAG: hypothetical protein ABI813_12735 [Bacteroidota bacterium]